MLEKKVEATLNACLVKLSSTSFGLYDYVRVYLKFFLRSMHLQYLAYYKLHLLQSLAM